MPLVPRLRTVLPFALLLAIVAGPAAAGDAPLDAAIGLVEAQRSFDVPTLERLLAPGYLEISPVGDVDDRAKVISFYSPEAKAGFAAAGTKALTVHCDEQISRRDGDRAVVTFKETAGVSIQGKPRTTVMRVQMHLRRQDGRWLVETAQYTPFHPQAPAKPAS